MIQDHGNGQIMEVGPPFVLTGGELEVDGSEGEVDPGAHSGRV